VARGFFSKLLEQKPAKPVQMKRFTLDVPLELHTRIKTQCAARA
jgi:hypothetical protein